MLKIDYYTLTLQTRLGRAGIPRSRALLAAEGGARLPFPPGFFCAMNWFLAAER